MDEFRGLAVEVDGALVVGRGGAPRGVGEVGREVGEATQSHWRDEKERERNREEEERGIRCTLFLSACLPHR